MSSRRWRFFVEDMIRAIERIQSYVGNMTFEEFARNDLLFCRRKEIHCHWRSSAACS